MLLILSFSQKTKTSCSKVEVFDSCIIFVQGFLGFQLLADNGETIGGKTMKSLM